MNKSGLRESTRQKLIEAVMGYGQYFGVLILGIQIYEETQPPAMIVDVQCERGEKSGSFTIDDTSAGIVHARDVIKQIVGDWTK